MFNHTFLFYKNMFYKNMNLILLHCFLFFVVVGGVGVVLVVVDVVIVFIVFVVFVVVIIVEIKTILRIVSGVQDPLGTIFFVWQYFIYITFSNPGLIRFKTRSYLIIFGA